MVFKAAPTSPTSVRGSGSGIRRDRSPSVMPTAVSSTCRNGRKDRRTAAVLSTVTATRTSAPTASSSTMSLLTVASTEDSDLATITDPVMVGVTTTASRRRERLVCLLSLRLRRRCRHPGGQIVDLRAVEPSALLNWMNRSLGGPLGAVASSGGAGGAFCVRRSSVSI